MYKYLTKIKFGLTLYLKHIILLIQALYLGLVYLCTHTHVHKPYTPHTHTPTFVDEMISRNEACEPVADVLGLKRRRRTWQNIMGHY